MSDNGPGIAGSVLAIALLILFGLGTCYAPCAWFGCAPTKDVPGRCLKEMLQ